MSIQSCKNVCARTIIFILVLAALIASSPIIYAEEDKNRQFWTAVAANDIERVKQLIADGADVNYLVHGRSPLQTAVGACKQGLPRPGCSEEIIRILLCHGADPNHIYANSPLPTMIHLMCTPPNAKNIPIVRLLLCFGADPNAKNSESQTPLGYVAGFEESKYGLGMAKLLLEFGANPRLPNNKGVTPIDEAECSISHIGIIPCSEKTREVPMNPKMAALMKASAGHSTYKPACSDIDCPNRCKLIVEGLKHKIIPAHEKYRNELSFRVECPKDLSKEKCPVTITTKTNKGELTAGGKTGKTLQVLVQPGEQQAVTYRWKGPTSMNKAQEEVITLLAESPGGKATETAEFSVGIDLTIKEVKWVAGAEDLCPGKRPFIVKVQDAFHTDADMAALSKTFDIKPQLKVEKAPGGEDLEFSYTGYGVMAGMIQMLTKLSIEWGFPVETSLKIDAECSPNQWSIEGSQNYGRLKCESREFPGNPDIKFPFKGKYAFNADIAHEVDSQPGNNTKAFRARVKEDSFYWRMVNEVACPFIEGAFIDWVSPSLLWRIQECWYSLIPNTSSGSSGSIISYALQSMTTCAMEIIGASEVTELWKKSFFVHNVTYHACLAVGNYFKLYNTECTAQEHKPVLDDFIMPLFTQRSTGGTRASDLTSPNPFPIAQAMAKGLKGKVRFVYLDKASLSRFRVESSKVGRLSKGTLKPPSEKQFKRRWKKNIPMFPKERMLDYDRFVLIPVENGEKLKLRLKGKGKPGGFVVINEDSASYAKFPSKKWSSDVEIDGSGKPKINGRDAKSIKVFHTEK